MLSFRSCQVFSEECCGTRLVSDLFNANSLLHAFMWRIQDYILSCFNHRRFPSILRGTHFVDVHSAGPSSIRGSRRSLHGSTVNLSHQPFTRRTLKMLTIAGRNDCARSAHATRLRRLTGATHHHAGDAAPRARARTRLAHAALL